MNFYAKSNVSINGLNYLHKCNNTSRISIYSPWKHHTLYPSGNNSLQSYQLFARESSANSFSRCISRGQTLTYFYRQFTSSLQPCIPTSNRIRFEKKVSRRVYARFEPRSQTFFTFGNPGKGGQNRVLLQSWTSRLANRKDQELSLSLSLLFVFPMCVRFSWKAMPIILTFFPSLLLSIPTLSSRLLSSLYHSRPGWKRGPHESPPFCPGK